jgi:uncharacterized protein (TIGR03067 family)
MVREPGEAHEKRSTFALQAGAPPRMDLTTVFEDGRPTLHTKAIYEVDAGTLRYCVGAPGQPRPETLATKPGDGATLVVLRRVTS